MARCPGMSVDLSKAADKIIRNMMKMEELEIEMYETLQEAEKVRSTLLTGIMDSHGIVQSISESTVKQIKDGYLNVGKICRKQIKLSYETKKLALECDLEREAGEDNKLEVDEKGINAAIIYSPLQLEESTENRGGVKRSISTKCHNTTGEVIHNKKELILESVHQIPLKKKRGHQPELKAQFVCKKTISFKKNQKKRRCPPKTHSVVFQQVEAISEIIHEQRKLAYRSVQQDMSPEKKQEECVGALQSYVAKDIDNNGNIEPGFKLVQNNHFSQEQAMANVHVPRHTSGFESAQPEQTISNKIQEELVQPSASLEAITTSEMCNIFPLSPMHIPTCDLLEDYYVNSVPDTIQCLIPNPDDAIMLLENSADVLNIIEPNLPFDPNGIEYCICRYPSFGDMIACSNKKCPIEWFHYPCVGVTIAPKGKWFCQQCSALVKHASDRKK